MADPIHEAAVTTYSVENTMKVPFVIKRADKDCNRMFATDQRSTKVIAVLND